MWRRYWTVKPTLKQPETLSSVIPPSCLHHSKTNSWQQFSTYHVARMMKELPTGRRSRSIFLRGLSRLFKSWPTKSDFKQNHSQWFSLYNPRPFQRLRWGSMDPHFTFSDFSRFHFLEVAVWKTGILLFSFKLIIHNCWVKFIMLWWFVIVYKFG